VDGGHVLPEDGGDEIDRDDCVENRSHHAACHKEHWEAHDKRCPSGWHGQKRQGETGKENPRTRATGKYTEYQHGRCARVDENSATKTRLQSGSDQQSEE